MPRKPSDRRGGVCHVCSFRLPTGAWRDQHGNVLAACGDPGCVQGYTYSHTLRRHTPEMKAKRG